ncbi:hypothetical protein FOL46_000942, partial [Perkinsus olseni]
TYKAVEKNGTICPELPGLTDFEMVVTDGEEGQLVNLTAIAEGLPTYDYICKASPSITSRRFISNRDLLRRHLRAQGTYKAVEKNGTICPELPGLTDFEMVVTDGEEGQLVNLTAIAEGLPTYDYICKASPSITSHKKTKQKREHVQQELLPHRESRE